MNRYHWNCTRPNLSLLESFTKRLGIREAFCEVLFRRGIDTYEKAEQFFRPDIKNLHPPTLMRGMSVATERIIEAIKKQENILILGDYDVDGTTATASLILFLSRQLGCRSQNLSYYIPNRLTEGYGLQEKSKQYVLNQKPHLFLTLDCGISSVTHIEDITRQGIDCIICDHHLPAEQLPPALAILNPKQEQCTYPYKDLCACGVVFKLIQSLALAVNLPIETTYEYLDLVALATAADIVPMTGENRLIVHYGIQLLNQDKRRPVASLARIARVSSHSVENIVFKIAPRINAAGRIGHAKEAVDLLLENNNELLDKLVYQLEEKNTTRRSLQENTVKEAEEELAKIEIDKQFSIFLSSPNWSKGILGIVASKLVDKYYRPVVIGSIQDEKCVASARSIKGVHLVNILSQCSQYLENYGGHEVAAGMTIKVEKLNDFVQAFETEVTKQLNNKLPQRAMNIDAILPFSAINEKSVHIIESMQPFGPGNLNPVWKAKNATLVQPPKVIKDKYVKLLFEQDGKRFASIIFDEAMSYLPFLAIGKSYNLAYKLRRERWNGKTTISCIIQDIEIG